MPDASHASRSWNARIIALPRTEPPGRLVRGAGGELEAFDEEGKLTGRWMPSPLPHSSGVRGLSFSDQTYPPARRGALAQYSSVGRERGPRVCPKRARVVGLYTDHRKVPR